MSDIEKSFRTILEEIGYTEFSGQYTRICEDTHLVIFDKERKVFGVGKITGDMNEVPSLNPLECFKDMNKRSFGDYFTIKSNVIDFWGDPEPMILRKTASSLMQDLTEIKKYGQHDGWKVKYPIVVIKNTVYKIDI